MQANEKSSDLEISLNNRFKDGSYKRALAGEAAENRFREASFNTHQKLVNRLHLNNCKLSAIDDKLQRMYGSSRRCTHGPKLEQGQGNNSMVGDDSLLNSSFATDSMIYSHDSYLYGMGGSTATTGGGDSSWLLTSQPDESSVLSLSPRSPVAAPPSGVTHSPLKKKFSAKTL